MSCRRGRGRRASRSSASAWATSRAARSSRTASRSEAARRRSVGHDGLGRSPVSTRNAVRPVLVFRHALIFLARHAHCSPTCMGGVDMTTRFFALALIAGAAACTEAAEEEVGTSARALSEHSSLSAGLVTGRIYDDLARNTDARMGDFSALGVKKLRVEIENTTPLATYRQIVEAAQSQGIEVLAVVGQ